MSISLGECSLSTIVAVPFSSHRQEIKYQKHFFRFRLPPVLNNFLSKFWAIASISVVNFSVDAMSLYSSVVAVFISDVSSTYASPILDILDPAGVFSWKQLYLTAIDHKIGSSTETQMDGDAQLPWPVPRILRRAFVWYVLAEMPWPVRMR